MRLFRAIADFESRRLSLSSSGDPADPLKLTLIDRWRTTTITACCSGACDAAPVALTWAEELVQDRRACGPKHGESERVIERTVLAPIALDRFVERAA